MDTRKIRDSFIAFFADRDHGEVPSSSLVPNDPTLLLTNAGMNQFKPYFLGEQSPPHPRAVSVQKCFRATDIDEVGDASHLTFFEMLGNFSFGDYYKSKACAWAWELVTEVWGIDAERLWATVYETDDEAREIWIDEVGVPEERVVRRGKDDNFWYGAGPCGPCSEIFADLGERFGEASPLGPAGNEERYLEIWNLVFMQNECTPAIEPVAELPQKNIDTGAGLERVALVLQGRSSVYETDTLGGMVGHAEELVGKRFGTDARTDRGLRVLADHGRALTFLIADGVLPSNEERGYVLRRVMRRAVRHARLLGRSEPVLESLIDATVGLMGDAYPELEARRDFAIEVANREEERFDSTLKQGLSLLESEIDKARDLGAGIPGEVAFKLHDTFGFPIDITKDVAGEAGLEVDIPDFESRMNEQRERARAAGKSELSEHLGDLDPVVGDLPTTEFVGYEHLTGDASVLALVADGAGIPAAAEGRQVDVILDRTPFYAEGGGQVGDRGTLDGPSGSARVLDTRRLLPGLTAHRVEVTSGELAVGDAVTAHVDGTWREGSQRAHTATHILHWILRDSLGEHATQAGSLVEPGRLRFDFNHFEPLGDRVGDIAEQMQSLAMGDDPVRAYETSYDFARSIGAMAIFGEKYGDVVRVVEVGDYSKELCGGTHVPHTSRIGAVIVTAEGSVGANLRRIEALVGDEGLAWLKQRVSFLEEAAGLLKTNPDDVVERIEKLLGHQKELEQKVASVERAAAESEASDLASAAQDVNGTRLVVARSDGSVDSLRALAQKLKGELGSSVVILGTAADSKANLVGAVTKDVAEKGVSARDLLQPGARLLGGGAGGKPELSICGGPNADKIDEALEAAGSAARQALSA